MLQTCYFKSKIVRISRFPEQVNVRVLNNHIRCGPTFIINVFLHHLLELRCRHSKTDSDVWDSIVLGETWS